MVKTREGQINCVWEIPHSWEYWMIVLGAPWKVVASFKNSVYLITLLQVHFQRLLVIYSFRIFSSIIISSRVGSPFPTPISACCPWISTCCRIWAKLGHFQNPKPPSSSVFLQLEIDSGAPFRHGWPRSTAFGASICPKMALQVTNCSLKLQDYLVLLVPDCSTAVDNRATTLHAPSNFRVSCKDDECSEMLDIDKHCYLGAVKFSGFVLLH